jgi:hypothetical protein
MIKRKGVLEDSFGRIGQPIMLNNVVGNAAQTRQFSGLVPDTTVIFAKTDITHVMQSILDALYALWVQCPRMALAEAAALLILQIPKGHKKSSRRCWRAGSNDQPPAAPNPN